VIWVLIDYDNGHWTARGIEGVTLHGNGPGTVRQTGTSVVAYENLQETVVKVYLKAQFPDELLIPMWLHTNHAKSRLEQAEKEYAERHGRRAA
jgi:hypothetical protein